MSKKSMKPIAAAVGAAFAGSMLVAGSAGAAQNPFGMTELDGGYMQVADAKCGAKKAEKEEMVEKVEKVEKKAETKCGANKTMTNGKCGGNKVKEMPAKAKAYGKCGAAKCGTTK